MSQILKREISKTKEESYLREIEDLFLKIRDNNKSIKQENKQIERLRKTNDESFARLRQTVENLRAY